MMGLLLESLAKWSHNLWALKWLKYCSNTLFLLGGTAFEPYIHALQSPGKENVAHNFLHV